MTRLILSPHVDDDVLGCGGILDEWTVTFYCGVDPFHVVSWADRLREAQDVANRTGGQFWWPCTNDQYAIASAGALAHPGISTYRTDRQVNRYDVPSLIHDIEQAITALEPREVFLPWPSYNQDHRAVFEAAQVALRPHDTIPFVPRVLVYEQPHVALWDHLHGDGAFRPTYFVPIDADEKVARYECMPSQVRDFRSPATIRALAALRGAAARVPAAEAFEVLRWVSD